MTEVFLLMAYMGGFCLLWLASSILLMVCAFAVHKKSKGKLTFWQFAKRWKV